MLAAFLTGLLGGFLNTPHCLGMCGGFPVHLEKSSGSGRVVLRQVLFILGKSFTYMFLGTLAAALGVVVFKDTSLSRAAPILRLAAGVITLVFGLLMLGFQSPSIKIADAGLLQSIFGGLFANPSPIAAFTLGLGAGFLPCPLPMGLLAVAALSHNIPHGMTIMGGLGLGTAPGLLGVGLLGIGLDRKYTRVGMNAAGVVLVVIGIMTIVRVIGAMPQYLQETLSLDSARKRRFLDILR